MEYKICRLSELSDEQIEQATVIMVDGLYNVLSLLSKDRKVLVELFKDSFHYDMNYACLHNGEVVGFMGIGNSIKRPASNMKKETFERLLNKNTAAMAYKHTSPAFSKINVESEREVEIEFLATASHFRGKGVATRLMQYLCDNFDYDYCKLDVYSKNLNAIRLYEKFGFNQIKVKSQLMLMLLGRGKTITMRLNIKEMLGK